MDVIANTVDHALLIIHTVHALEELDGLHDRENAVVVRIGRIHAHLDHIVDAVDLHILVLLGILADVLAKLLDGSRLIDELLLLGIGLRRQILLQVHTGLLRRVLLQENGQRDTL